VTTKTKAVLIVVGGLILVAIGIFASVLLIQRFQANQLPASAVENTVKTSVVVVTRDLFLGARIAATDVKLVSVPVENAPRDAITVLEEVVGKIIKSDLVQGEMVLSHNLADPTNVNKDLSFILDEDHVMMAFPGDDLMSRQSMVQRGDVVDIFASFAVAVQPVGASTSTTNTGEAQGPVIRTYTVDSLQKVSITAMVLEVVAEGNDTAPNRGSRILAYLLALNPQDALVLKHLKDTGAIFDLVLRAPTSRAKFDLTPVTEQYIIEYYGLNILP
jgi:pilus assembly protein CpaB